MVEIKTFIFLDCETTGLPHLENNRTKITELCLAGVESAHISLGVYPRVLNKLNLCFNPQKQISYTAAEITGLTNEILQYQPAFSTDTVNLIKHFLEQFKKPVCFVAHNGKRFDFPIIRAEIHKTGNTLPEDILCIDSLIAFKQLHCEDSMRVDETDSNNKMEAEPEESIFNTSTTSNDVPLELCDEYDELLFNAVENFENNRKVRNENDAQKENETTPPRSTTKSMKSIPKAPAKKTVVSYTSRASSSRAILFIPPPSFKLADVYKRLTCSEPEVVHEAEGDVKLLIHCAATLGDRFTDWANRNYTYFKDMPIMSPHKKIGT